MGSTSFAISFRVVNEKRRKKKALKIHMAEKRKEKVFRAEIKYVVRNVNKNKIKDLGRKKIRNKTNTRIIENLNKSTKLFSRLGTFVGTCIIYSSKITKSNNLRKLISLFLQQILVLVFLYYSYRVYPLIFAFHIYIFKNSIFFMSTNNTQIQVHRHTQLHIHQNTRT